MGKTFKVYEVASGTTHTTPEKFKGMTEGDAKAKADEIAKGANERAKDLGIKARYEVQEVEED
jgi:hypothetical protein